MKRLILACALALLSGCATQQASKAWIHPDWGTAYTSRDLSICRKQADEDIGRKVGRDDYLDRDASERNSPMRETDSIRNRYEFDRYVSNCMMALGYRRTKSAGSAN